MKNNINRPATLLPPPLIYIGFLAGAWWLDRRIPNSFDAGWVGPVLGWGLVGLGIVGFGWALLSIARHHTTVNPYKAATVLVTTGPFRFSRNPIYVSDWLVYAGVTLILQTLWPVLLAPVVWALIRYAVIRHEEAHLQAKFGPAYTAYCQTTRRWL